jgi:hypothetical protein
MDPMKIFVPITKVDAVKREVWGVLAEEAPDKSREIFDYASSVPHFKAWSEQFQKATVAAGQEESKGNLRSMHEKIAAGKFIAIEYDDAAKKVLAGAKVVDDQEWAKVQEGVYTGFSIGGAYAKRWKDGDLTRYTAVPAEGSLVDNPCMYGATFQVVKADGSSELRKFASAWKVELTDEVRGRIEAALKAYDDAEGSLRKDAMAAIGSANDAIAALKQLAIELLSLPGEPDTWTLESILSAIRGAITGKISAEYEAANPVEVPGAGPDEPTKTQDVGDLVKRADVDALVKSVVEAHGLTKLAGDLAAGLKKLEELQDALAKATSPEAILEAAKTAVSEAAKTAADAAVDAVKKVAEAAAPKEAVEGLDKRVKAIEDEPKPLGRRVDKTLGVNGSGGDPNVAKVTEAISGALSKAVEEGVPKEQVDRMRIHLVAEVLRAM